MEYLINKIRCGLEIKSRIKNYLWKKRSPPNTSIVPTNLVLKHLYRGVKRGLGDLLTRCLQPRQSPPPWLRERHGNSKQGAAAAKKGENNVTGLWEKHCRFYFVMMTTPHFWESKWEERHYCKMQLGRSGEQAVNSSRFTYTPPLLCGCVCTGGWEQPRSPEWTAFWSSTPPRLPVSAPPECPPGHLLPPDPTCSSLTSPAVFRPLCTPLPPAQVSGCSSRGAFVS